MVTTDVDEIVRPTLDTTPPTSRNEPAVTVLLLMRNTEETTLPATDTAAAVLGQLSEGLLVKVIVDVEILLATSSMWPALKAVLSTDVPDTSIVEELIELAPTYMLANALADHDEASVVSERADKDPNTRRLFPPDVVSVAVD